MSDVMANADIPASDRERRHLPECPWADRGYAFPCICDRLRACEQRVLEDQAWVDHAREIEAHARSLALNAAREAVVSYADETHQHVGINQCWPESGDRCDVTAAIKIAAGRINLLEST